MNRSWTIGSLPGPRRYLDLLYDDLHEGLSCVWLLPDSLVDNGIAEKLLDDLAVRCGGIRVPAPEIKKLNPTVALPVAASRSAAMPSRGSDRFGLLESPPMTQRVEVTPVERATISVAERMLSVVRWASGLEHDELERVAASEWSRRKVFVLRAWDEPAASDVGSVLVRFAAMMKEIGLSPKDRPKLLVAARESDLSRSELRQVDRMTARIHWWWGCTGRLDTEVVVVTARPPRRLDSRSTIVADLVFNAVVVEVAGPDLALAEHLASTWDGTVVVLPERIKEFLTFSKCFSVTVGQDGRAGHERPPEKLRPAWESGLVDLWDGEVRISPALDQQSRPGPDLNTLIWRGQSRALTPVIDRCRAYLTRKFESRARNAVLNQLLTPDGGSDATARRSPATLELRDMSRAVLDGRVRLDPPDRKLLSHSLRVRNALAHMIPLSDDDLRELLRLIPNDVW
jgi:hypothetical protein